MFTLAAKRTICLVFMLLGGGFVSNEVDITPIIGSPQIDYPDFNPAWPFWPQLLASWFVFGVGGALAAALAMAFWTGDATPLPDWRRLGRVWATWFALVGGLQLAGFLAGGTMGPLGAPQPIVRFALANGAVSASTITGAFWLVRTVVGLSRAHAETSA